MQSQFPATKERFQDSVTWGFVMNVFVVVRGVEVQTEGCNQAMVLDLVAHFVGMAIHHNENAVPRQMLDQKPKTLP
ncbi:MAG: hypothetical protein MRY81_07435 [Donghicola eburneus]|jgi:hypothetical protein|nr:hypothetical protein [Donghicola eburneus]MCI5039500.1 hypothetical protein [Donghicola eburneus]